MLTISALWAALALSQLPLAPAQAPVLPNVNLEFNLTLPPGAVLGDTQAWIIEYENTTTFGSNNATLGSGPTRLVWNHSYDYSDIFGMSKLYFEGVVRNAYVWGDMGHNEQAQNVTFWETDQTQVENMVTPPEDGKGLLGKVEGLGAFRRSKLDPYGAYNGMWAVLDQDWGKRPGKPIIDEVVVTTAIESSAKSFDDLNKTVLPFATAGKLSDHPSLYFRTWDADSNDTWTTTSGYAQKQRDGSSPIFAALSREHEAAASPITGPAGGVIWVDIPANTSFIVVNGSRGPEFGWLNLGGTPIDGYAPFQSNTQQATYVANEMLFWRSISPHVKYNISLGTYNNPERPLFLTSITFYSDMPPQPEGDRTGAIVGGVVGGVGGGLLILGGIGYWFWRRKRRREHQKMLDEEDKFEIDGPITPFEDPRPPPPPLRKVEGDPAAEAVRRAEHLQALEAREALEREAREQREIREVELERERQISANSGGDSGSATPPSLKQQTLQALDNRNSPSSSYPVTPITGPNTPLTGYPSFMLGTPITGQSHANLLPTPVTPGGNLALLAIPEASVDGTLGASPTTPTRMRPRAIDVGAVDDGSDEDAMDPPAYNPEWTRPRTRPQRRRIVVPQAKTPSSTMTPAP